MPKRIAEEAAPAGSPSPSRRLTIIVGTTVIASTTVARANAAAGAGSISAPPIATATTAPTRPAISCALVAAGRPASSTSSATIARWPVVRAFRPAYTNAADSPRAR
jgi:hypothetical protein